MLGNTLFLLTILGMALVTYATRICGLWLMGLVTPSNRVHAWLRHIPGAVLVSIVVPTIFTGSFVEIFAAVLTVLVAWRTKNVLLAMVVGVCLVATLHFFVP